MADKYNVVEPKIPIGILASIGAAIAVVLILVFVAIPSNSEKIYLAYESTANEYFTEDHPYDEVSGNKIERMINREETFILLISSSDCTACQEHIGTIQRYYESTGIAELFNQIYYLSPLDDADGFASLAENVEGIDSTTPQLVLVMNGEVVLEFNPDLSTSDQARNTNVRTFFEDAIAALEEE